MLGVTAFALAHGPDLIHRNGTYDNIEKETLKKKKLTLKALKKNNIEKGAWRMELPTTVKKKKLRRLGLSKPDEDGPRSPPVPSPLLPSLPVPPPPCPPPGVFLASYEILRSLRKS